MKRLSLSKPHMLMIVGIPGSGKTAFAEKFAETFHAPCVSYDTIQVLGGGDPSSVEALATYQLDELLKTNQSVILDGGTDTRVSRLELARKARAAGYESLVIWIQTDPATAKARALRVVKGREHQLDEEGYEQLLKRFTAPTKLEKAVVISGRHTYASQAKVVLGRLSAPRAEQAARAVPSRRPEQPSRHNITIT